MDRLARSCKDWHDLMEQCTWCNTLLADRDAVYDPTVFNDRLLLGLKAILSEAELHLIRQRMNLGRMNKARRGELFTSVPMGYIRNGSGIALDPDAQVQSVLRWVFDKFDELGTVGAVLRAMASHQVLLGVRGHRGRTRAGSPGARRHGRALQTPPPSDLFRLLCLWIDQERPWCAPAGRRGPRRVAVPPLQWEVLIPEHVPAYITWERYLAHLRRLATIDRGPDAARAPAWGIAARRARLLRPMLPADGGVLSQRGPAGELLRLLLGGQPTRPTSVSTAGGSALDALAAELVLEAIRPAALELSLAAAADLQAERQRCHDLWRQRLQRGTVRGRARGTAVPGGRSPAPLGRPRVGAAVGRGALGAASG